MKLLNQFITPGVMPAAYEETPDGFLRVKARPLKEGVMPYMRHELGELPPELDGVEPVFMLVAMDALSSGETLRSLEAARVTAPEHVWVTTDNAADVQKGSAAGAASVVGPFQEVDLLITDEATIAGIKARELGELSGGYNAEALYAPGEWNGQPYHMKQTNIIYNHIAVICPGEGRGGSDVRIINHKAQLKNTDGGMEMGLIKMKLANTGKFVNVDEETAAAIEAEQNAGDEKVATSERKLEESLAECTELKAQQEEITAALEECKGELSVYQEKISELLSDENAEAQATAMVEESGEADEIIENACGDDKKKVEEIKNSIGRIGNTGIYKLRGAALQTAVLNAIGAKTENMTPGELKGAFKTHLHFANTSKTTRTTSKTVAGAGVFQNANPQASTTAARVSKMWGKKNQ